MPVDAVAEGALAEGDLAGAEEGEEFVAVEDDVGVGFLGAGFLEIFEDFEHGFEGIAGVARQFREGVVAGHAVDVQNVEDQDAVVGDDGAAGFGDDVGVVDAGFVHDFLDGFDEIGAVFAEAVGHGVFVGLFFTGVVDGEAAAEVEEAHGGAFFDEVDVDAGGFLGGEADGGDLGDLGALVVVEHAEALEFPHGLEVVDDADGLGEIEAEGGAIAGGFGPVAAAFGGEFDADAEGGFDAEFLTALHDEGEFWGHFEDEDDVEAELFGLEGEVDEFGVLVAIADEEGLAVVHEGEGGEEFGFGADFDAVVVLAAVFGDFFDDLLLLVDFDRVDAAVAAFVALVAHFLAEGFVEFLDAGVEEVGEAEEGGEVEVLIFFDEAADDLGEGDFGEVAVVLEADGDFAGFVAAEIAIAPGREAVEVEGILDAPGFWGGEGVEGSGGEGGSGKRLFHFQGGIRAGRVALSRQIEGEFSGFFRLGRAGGGGGERG